MVEPGRSRFVILALDVDGTLLDERGELSAATAQAVARAAAAGVRPVLCTGRRYRRALPVAEALGLDAPIVCNSGALVKDPMGHQTLWRADFDRETLAAIARLFADRDEPAVSFLDDGPSGRDFVVDRRATGRPMFDEFVELNRPHESVRPGWLGRAAESDKPGHFHLCAIGDRPRMAAFEAEAHAAMPGRLRTFVQRSPRYSGTMCELLRPDASKWAAVLHLAAIWGVDPAAICAVGDDANDVPMLIGAGLGVAMPHAPASVRAAADLVIEGRGPGALAAMIDRVVLA